MKSYRHARLGYILNVAMSWPFIFYFTKSLILFCSPRNEDFRIIKYLFIALI